MGFDRWFIFLSKAGVPGTTIAMLLVPMLLGTVVAGWLLVKEFCAVEAKQNAE
jgi:hypothetical protein